VHIPRGGEFVAFSCTEITFHFVRAEATALEAMRFHVAKSFAGSVGHALVAILAHI